jgi:hypothetical protein
MAPVARRGNLQDLADWLDPETAIFVIATYNL